jgi:1-aminocyclopropane-1-carboxylate deaminase/D-cysteine desulfhydrase-like pyridoxal-dependent ACC family enzyme
MQSISSYLKNFDALFGFNSVSRQKSKFRKELTKLPRVSLAHLPTPLDKCLNLVKELGIKSLYVKREDCSGLAFGGNKVRQHEYVLGKAISMGTDSIIQGAASQSNHSRQIAAAGAKLGLKVFLLPKKDQNIGNIQGNYFVDHLLGAQILPIEITASSGDAKNQLAAELRSKGHTPYISGMGATDSLILGAVACVDMLFEISDALGNNTHPDWIFTGSQGSTQAGLLLGCAILGWPTKVIGINPLNSSHEAYLTNSDIQGLIEEASKLLKFDKKVDPKRIVNDINYVGHVYGVPTPGSIAAIKLLASSEGILLDPIYSGKAFTGLLDYIEKGTVKENDSVVFVHTGGLPALFVHNETIIEGILNS